MFSCVTSKEVQDFISTLYEEGFVSFSNWPEWQSEADKYYSNSEMIKTVDLETIVKLFTTHIRKERFCEGHLDNMFKSGHITAILRRLRDVRGEVGI